MASSSFDELCSYMIPYIPYNSGQQDEDSQTLVYLKMNKVYDCNRRAKFERRIKKWVEGILDKHNADNKEVVLSIAPGHSTDSDGSGNLLFKILKEILENYPNTTIDGRILLYRHTEVTKSTDGGDRSQAKHERTISVREEPDVQDKIVFIFDDVWTTGSTLRACAKLVRDKNAKEVKLFAVGKTELLTI